MHQLVFAAFLATRVVDNALGSGLAGAIPVAFLVGVISFFTPCILPLVPGYLSFVSGLSGESLTEGTGSKRVLAGTLLFLLGFAVVFTAFGASATRGAILLFAFSLGFGMWFVLGGLAFRRATAAISWLRRHQMALQVTGGLVLITIGILLVTNQWLAVIAPLRRLVTNYAPPV